MVKHAAKFLRRLAWIKPLYLILFGQKTRRMLSTSSGLSIMDYGSHRPIFSVENSRTIPSCLGESLDRLTMEGRAPPT